MKFLNVLVLYLLLAVCHGTPLKERSTVAQTGTRVAVVSGLIINTQIAQCFQNSGADLATAYAAAIADQFQTYCTQHGYPFRILSLEGIWATDSTSSLYCTTVDAIFNFPSQYSATVFAVFARNLMGNTKRSVTASEDVKHDFSLGDLHPDVYVAGIDLPANHDYFGPNGNITVGNASDDLSKRSWGRCSNNKCGFSFTSDQTGICRDTKFPTNNYRFC